MGLGSKFHAAWSQVLRFKRSLAMIAVVAFMVFGTDALHNMSSRSADNPEAIIEARNSISQVQRETDIIVNYEAPYTLTDGSPPSVQGYSITLKPLEMTFLPVVAQGLKKAVLPYPPGFLQKYCGLVFIPGDLEIDDTQVGGTYGPKWIMISGLQELNLDTKVRETALQETFHHECASQIYTTDAGAILGFGSFFPQDFIDAGIIRDEVAQAAKPAPDPSTGYLNAYATTGPSNDFSEYAEYVFSKPEQIRDLASRHPKVREKLNMFIASYERADPGFKEYFDAQGLRDTEG